jgi:hypothetical protein
MASPATVRTEEHSSNHTIVKNKPSTRKTIGFAIVTILGLGSLVAAGVGLGGYLQAGSLSSIGQVNSIIMMSACGGGGIVFLVVGIVGSVKNCQRKSLQNMRDVVSTIDTKGGLIYGADAWKIWNVEVLDKVPELPNVDLSQKDKILLYIPQRVRVNGKEKDFNLKTLIEIQHDRFKYFSPIVENQFQHTTAAGWALIDKAVIPESRSQDYETQKTMVESKGGRLPSVLEAIVLNLMVFDFTGERLYGHDPCTFTRCAEKVNGKFPVVVGDFTPDGLNVSCYTTYSPYGVACAYQGL